MKSILNIFKWSLVQKREVAAAEERITALEAATQASKQQDATLRHHLRLLDVLLNTIPEPVFFQDVDGVLQGCNLSFSDQIVGLPREKILGRSLAEIGRRAPHELPEDLFQHPADPPPAAGMTQVEGQLRCADDGLHDFIFSRAAIFNSRGEMTGAVGVMIDITGRKRAEAEKERLIEELQEALATVKTLRGLLPVCSFCKKIRDDKGYWQQLEAYIQDHSEAVFSHSICEECARSQYPEIYADKA